MKNYTRIFGVIIFALACITYMGERVVIYFKPDYDTLEWWHYLVMLLVSVILFVLTDDQLAGFARKFLNKKIDKE